MKKGIESFTDAVKKDCQDGQNCFNENGCDQDRPKCFHRYCNKYLWVINRAKQYEQVTGIPYLKIIEEWETNRTYWYMNYYQECNQVELKPGKFMLYKDWVEELNRRFGKDAKQWRFKCVQCGHIQTIQDFLNHNIEHPESKVFYNCIGRYVSGIGCDWSLGGLLQINTMTVIRDGQPIPVFEMDEEPNTTTDETKDN